MFFASSARRVCASSYKFRSKRRDAPGRFLRKSQTGGYSYDANSNRLSGTDATTSDTDLDGDFDSSDLQRTTAQTPVIANDSNRLLGWSQINTTQRLNAKGQPVSSSTSTQINYGLDAAGNLTSDGLRTFSYDASNRLSQVQVGDADEASKVSYLHNAAGQRVFKSEPQVAQTAPSEEQLGTDFITWLKKNFGWLFAQAQQNTTLGQSYVYGDGALNSYNLLGEYGNGGTKSAGRLEYIYLPTETGTAQLIGLYKNNRFYAVHTDHLGTPRSITDDTNKVVWQWAYSAFGDNKPTGILKATTNPRVAITNQPKLLQAASPSLAVNLRFAGQYWDDESKLSYNYFRSYQPNQGRYTQFDPIGLRGGPNGYLYANGAPTTYTDPLGLLVELRCRPADIAAGMVNHCWLKTDTVEAGMNAQASCSRAGNDDSGLPFQQVVVSDHRCDKPTIITPLPNVNESCVNNELRIGKPLGRFAPPFNSCQTYTQEVIEKCSPSKYPRSPWR